MSHQTASNAIDEGVKTHRIIREEAIKGKQKIAFFTVHSDIREDEQYHLDQMEKLLEQFDLRFDFFTKKFPSLSIQRTWLLAKTRHALTFPNTYP